MTVFNQPGSHAVFQTHQEAIHSMYDLQGLLNQHGISTQDWVKSPEDLWRELQEGDCSLVVEQGKLLRKVEEVRVRCYFTTSAGETLQLHEDLQVFHTGKTRARNFDYVVEKRKFGESIENAALRGLEEELQIQTDRIILFPQPEKDCTKIQDSPSYPGIKSTYIQYNFAVQIPEDQFQPSYQEEQNGKTTYFTWQKV